MSTDGFTRQHLLSVVELSSSPMGFYDHHVGRVTSLNAALRSRVRTDHISVETIARGKGIVYGRWVERDLPIRLRSLAEDGLADVSVVEVTLAHAKDDAVRSDVVRLMDMASDGVWERFPVLRYEFMSDQFWNTLGYEQVEMPSSPDAWRSMVASAEDLKVASEIFAAHVDSKGAIPYNCTISYTHKKGHKVIMKYRGSVVEWLPSGAPWRVLGTQTNVTEAANAVEAKARYVARMSHEIRTPICAILHECELFEQSEGTSDVADACGQLLSLCNDILTVEDLHWPNAPVELSYGPAFAEEYFRKACMRHSVQARKNGVQLEASVGCTPQEAILLDMVKCDHVLDSLIDNAIEYTEPDGKVLIELTGEKLLTNEEGDGWQIEIIVKNKGRGLLPGGDDIIERSHSPPQKAGLSLCISKELALLMGGDVQVTESVVGKGSTVVFTLPASFANCTESNAGPTGLDVSAPTTSEAETVWTDVEQAVGAVRSASGQALASEGCQQGGGTGNTAPSISILNADDIAINRKIVRRRLQAIEGQWGTGVMEIVDAVDGQDAVRAFRERGGFDLVLMDCLMPGMNGFEASIEIHRLCDEMGTARVPVVAVTASVSTQLYQECRDAGMAQVVTKPFDTADLMSAFSAAMEAMRLSFIVESLPAAVDGNVRVLWEEGQKASDEGSHCSMSAIPRIVSCVVTNVDTPTSVDVIPNGADLWPPQAQR